MVTGKKKGSDIRVKGVAFNLLDEREKRIYDYVQSDKVRNFSALVKTLLWAYMTGSGVAGTADPSPAHQPATAPEPDPVDDMEGLENSGIPMDDED